MKVNRTGIKKLIKLSYIMELKGLAKLEAIKIEVGGPKTTQHKKAIKKSVNTIISSLLFRSRFLKFLANLFIFVHINI